MSTIYPSKVLLFGEYTVIHGSVALAIPFAKYRSHWSDTPAPDEKVSVISAKDSKKSLQKILYDLYAAKIDWVDLDRLENDIRNGLWFCSNVPTGYGLGSSGAVCAAIYKRYAFEPLSDLPALKEQLAFLEQSFHGKSSGIDPLIAYQQQALQVNKDGFISSVALPTFSEEEAVFLIDTHLPRSSTPLIEFFIQQSAQEPFETRFLRPARSVAKRATDFFLKGDMTNLAPVVGRLTALQLMYLPPMVPQMMHELWAQSLEDQQFHLKICGAGGGGFVLGFTKYWSGIQEQLRGYDVQRLF